jgi:general nucleoside transport system ATP-binding protein
VTVPALSSVPCVEMRGISKRFGAVLANDAIDLRIEAGEIHALLGENGAGKTTLMHILYGLMPPDAGTILWHGQPIRLSSPRQAMAQGIGMVHQHFMLVPNLTVTENMMLGQEVRRWGLWLDRRGAVQQVQALCARYHLDVDPHARIQEVSVGVRQRVEILKALYRQARLLILDEPTAVLTPAESEHLFQTLTTLAQQGTAIIFITHKLPEVYRIAQRITVLRSGRVVATTTPAAATAAQLAACMVGRTMAPEAVPRPPPAADTVLRIQDIQAVDDRQVLAVRGISLCVRAGEIVGIAGVQGNGQTVLVEVLTGLRPPLAGTVVLQGRDITHATPRQRWRLGMGHIPEDRHTYGLVARASVADNLILNAYGQHPFARGFLRNHHATLQQARHLMQTFTIRAAHAGAPVGSLSGGNQQKVVVARELSRPLRLLIAVQPTRGLDIAATAFIHQQIMQQRQHGCAILVVSADLEEIFALSDRISVSVLYQGTLVRTVEAQEATRETLGRWMAGL